MGSWGCPYLRRFPFSCAHRTLHSQQSFFKLFFFAAGRLRVWRDDCCCFLGDVWVWFQYGSVDRQFARVFPAS